MFDFAPYCVTCGWCCFGEDIYMSPQDMCPPFQGTGFPGACKGLDCQTSRCTLHGQHPIECRIFPLDILSLDGVITWVLWRGVCPAAEVLPPGYAEAEMLRWEIVMEREWVEGYVAHHLDHQPAKYPSDGYIPLRPLNLSR